MGRSAFLAGLTMSAAVCAQLAAESPAASTGSAAAPVMEPALEVSLGGVISDVAGPPAFFQLLVDRYRRLTWYRDTTQIVEITERSGQSPKRVEKRVACAIRDGELQITTPARQVLRRLGLALPLAPVPVLDAAAKEYDRWLAPHMTMKFASEPLQEFRPGVEDGFTATEVGPVTIDQKAMVHLQLKSGDGREEDCDATFDLFVDPESMLIERIEGEQVLADGASRQTTIQIDPQREAIVETVGTGTVDPPEDGSTEDLPPEDLPTDVLPPDIMPPNTPPPNGPPPTEPPPADEQDKTGDPTGEGRPGEREGEQAEKPEKTAPPVAPPASGPPKPGSSPPPKPLNTGSGSEQGGGDKGGNTEGPRKPKVGPGAPPPEADMFRLR